MSAQKENLLKRIENVQRIVKDNYEQGNQSKCKTQAYRNHVLPVYPMSERTFWRYVNTDINNVGKKNADDPRQLKLFE